MEIIPEFATPRVWMVYVFLILKSSATLRCALVHIGTLQWRVKMPTLWEYFHFLKRGAKRLVSKSENIPKVFYTFLQLRTQGKNTPFLSAKNKKRAILLRVFYFWRSKKANSFAPTGGTQPMSASARRNVAKKGQYGQARGVT